MRSVVLCLSLLVSSCLSSNTEGSGQVGQTTAAKKNVGPNGETIEVAGAVLTIPKSAVDKPIDVTISTTQGEGSPDGFVVLSSIFHCEPSGTTFAQPVTMKIPFRDDQLPVTMFWSSGADPAYKDVGGTATNGAMTATVMHFSSGFVGRRR